MKLLLKKAGMSIASSLGIVLLLFLISRSSKEDGGMFLFDIWTSAIAVMLLLACIGVLIGRLFRHFNIDLSIFLCAFGMVNLTLMLCFYSKGVSNLYFIVLIANAFVFLSLLLAISFALRARKRSVGML